MTDLQWDTLKKIIRGEVMDPLPTGFIIDCPWLPNWYGIRILDYFTNDDLWLKANLARCTIFRIFCLCPDSGLNTACTEPSAFGSRCPFPANEFPHAEKVIHSLEQIDDLPLRIPVPMVCSLCAQSALAQPAIEAEGHKIRFAGRAGR